MANYYGPCVCGGHSDMPNPDCERCMMIQALDDTRAAARYFRKIAVGRRHLKWSWGPKALAVWKNWERVVGITKEGD